MTWLRWIGVALVVCAVLCLGVGWFFRETLVSVGGAVAALFEEPDWVEIEDGEDWWRYAMAHPESFSLVAYSVDETGAPIAETVIRHRADEPRLLASTVKIVVLSTLARARDEGAIDPQEPVRLGDWDSWYLAGTDAGAHGNAYDGLGLAHDGGFASDPDHTVPLQTVADAMIRHSDNAATDWLIHRLGDRLDQEAELLGHEPIESLLADDFRALSDDPCNTPLPDVSDPDERAARIARGVSMGTLASQRAAFACGPAGRGRAEVYAAIQAGVVTGTHISPEASAWMASALDWPMDFEGNQQMFETFGTKGGALPGVITEASFVVPKTGDFAGQRRVVVFFAEGMSGSAWLANMGSYAHQDFVVKLATERAFVDQVRADLASL